MDVVGLDLQSFQSLIIDRICKLYILVQYGFS